MCPPRRGWGEAGLAGDKGSMPDWPQSHGLPGPPEEGVCEHPLWGRLGAHQLEEAEERAPET